VPISCQQNLLPESELRDQLFDACRHPDEDTYLQVLGRLFDEADGYATLAYLLAKEDGSTMSFSRWQRWMSQLRGKQMLVQRNGSLE